MAEKKTDEIKDKPKEEETPEAVEEKTEAVKETAPQKPESTETTEEKTAAPEETETKAAAEQTEEPQEEVQPKEEEAAEKTVAAKSLGNLAFLPELRTDLPELKTGDVIRVSYRVIEGGKERIQVFEGTIIAMKNSGISKTITVRKTSFGIAVERIFPVNSKLVHKIEVKKHSKVRRSKLYYLRKLKGKAARLKELR